MKKFLLIPILIVAYVYFVMFITQVNFQTIPTDQIDAPPGVQAIGMGDSVSISVTRLYFFGLVRLPVYSASLGDIGGYHEAFFYFILALTVIFIIHEIKYKKKRKGEKMAKKASPNKFIMPIVWGILFALVAFILSGDASSIVIGLLVMYLEYKLGK